MKELFYSVDFLTTQPSLCINKSKFHTLFASFISFLVIVLSIALGLYLLLHFFSRKEFNVTNRKTSDDINNVVNLSNSLFMVQYSSDYYDETYFYPSFMYFYRDDQGYVTAEEAKFEKCNFDLIPSHFRNKFTEKELATYLCISPNQNIILQTNSQNETSLVATIYFCNKFFNNSCKEQNVIIDKY